MLKFFFERFRYCAWGTTIVCLPMEWYHSCLRLTCKLWYWISQRHHQLLYQKHRYICTEYCRCHLPMIRNVTTSTGCLNNICTVRTIIFNRLKYHADVCAISALPYGYLFYYRSFIHFIPIYSLYALKKYRKRKLFNLDICTIFENYRRIYY